jgi:peptidoglycan-associated lipoprotein
LGEIARLKDTTMKLTTFTKFLALGLVLTVAAVGCRKNPYGVTPLPKAPGPAVAGPGPGEPLPGPGIGPGAGTGSDNITSRPGPDPSSTGGIPQGPPGSHIGWKEDAGIFKANTVYFDFDSSAIRTGEQAKVAAVADYLKSHAADAVRVEGHCDERGTEEYNRALGDRRAQALREDLVRLGIDPLRVETISFGEDRAANPGHNEEAYRQNRRGEFILLSPP